MNNPVLETLLLPFARGDVALAGACVFYNAQYHAGLKDFASLSLQQHFKPYAAGLEAQKFAVSAEPVLMPGALALLLLPKNMIEARYFMALALQGLEEGGVLVAAAANDAGGSRLVKIFEEFGLKDIDSFSKNRARVVWAKKENINEMVVAQALTEENLQPVLDGAFQSQPGLFSWDRADKGSEALVRELPEILKGRGADFGCGYGWLARQVVTRAEHLTCIDADARALAACKINLKAHSNVEYVWEDLAQSGKGHYDWVVMNPPFHDGKKTDSAIGKKFIARAAQNLKPGGHLWMVANAQLPYEDDLKKLFSSTTKKFEGQGFKVYHAVK